MARPVFDREIKLWRAGKPDTDTAGNPVPGTGTPVEIDVQAEYMPVSDRERMAAKEVSAEYTARFVIRWSESVRGVNPTWWLTFDGRVYDITGAKEVGRRESIEITANTRADQ